MSDLNKKLSLKTLRHTSLLARIKLSPSEEKRFLRELSSIFDYIEILNQADTSKTPPSFQVVSQKSINRLDIVSPGFSQKQALSSAPQSQNAYFKVKATIEK